MRDRKKDGRFAAGPPGMKSFGLRMPVILAAVLCAVFLAGGLLRQDALYRDCGGENGACRAYYLLNIDGMKGLGHAALLLVDEQGEGQIFSYNGMQYNLFQCLLGKAGMGRMKQFSLDREAVEGLLLTGELSAGEYEECSNFDRALWRGISEEEYAVIQQNALAYIEAEREYERLCRELYSLQDKDQAGAKEAKARLDAFLSREDTPLYQIYTHNCDGAARELLALVDGDMAKYNASQAKLTPKGNYKNMCRKLGDAWGFCPLGKDTWTERLMDF